MCDELIVTVSVTVIVFVITFVAVNVTLTVTDAPRDIETARSSLVTGDRVRCSL